MPEENWNNRYSNILPAEDLGNISQFLRLVEQMQEREYFRDFSALEILVEIVGGQPTVVSNHGNLENLRSALLDIRKLVMNNENTNVNKIVNMLMRYEDDDERKELFRSAKKEIAGARKQPIEAGAPVGQKNRNQFELLQEVINRQLFHTDDPDGYIPNLSGRSLEDNNLIEVLYRQKLVEAIQDEYEYASWVSGFIRLKSQI